MHARMPTCMRTCPHACMRTCACGCMRYLNELSRGPDSNVSDYKCLSQGVKCGSMAICTESILLSCICHVSEPDGQPHLHACSSGHRVICTVPSWFTVHGLIMMPAGLTPIACNTHTCPPGLPFLACQVSAHPIANRTEICRDHQAPPARLDHVG